MRAAFLLLSALVIAAGGPARAGPADWKVVHSSWSPAHERKFAEFVSILGQSGCRTLQACLTSRASNPFYAERTPPALFTVAAAYLSDCADLPYSLRMYFAWMEGLPFDYVSAVAPVGGGGRDIRYTRDGNRPTAWRRFTPGHVYDAIRELRALRDTVSTAMYRMHFGRVSDFYPVKIDRAHVRPGTVVYDASGHAAMVYGIEADGRVRMIDAHPDQSITRITYDKKFARSRPAHGSGFKNWRPELDPRPSAELPGFSPEQFAAGFSIDGRPVDYYDFVRVRMAGGSLRYRPVGELRAMMTELCRNVRDRIDAVDAAIRAGIPRKEHPATLPANIYGTSGEWEEFSTPSRDARLKVAYRELRQEIERYVIAYGQGDPRIDYQPVDSRYSGGCGSDRGCFLLASLLAAYDEVAASPDCGFGYRNSAGAWVGISYDEMVRRLFALSFDPYHCVELRWGGSGDELRPCRDGRGKLDWYAAERGLRNQLERTYEAFMGYGPEDTRRKLGVARAPDVDLGAYLRRGLGLATEGARSGE